jgi:hypothetical protein
MKSGSRQLDFWAALYRSKGAKTVFKEISSTLRWRGSGFLLSQANAMFRRVVSRAKEMYEVPT